MITSALSMFPNQCFTKSSSQYFDHKLSTEVNGTIVPSEYKEYFLSNLSITAQLPNVLFSLFNVFVHFK